MKKTSILILVLLMTACTAVPVEVSTPLPTLPGPVSTPVEGLPPVVGPEPSQRVGAFYYPWYGNPETDAEWIHWNDNNHRPPADITSDYFPALGAYSSNDPAVVAQHMTWLRLAGVGVIIVSWWGQGGREERPVPLLLQMGERYGIKIAFHIEPYHGRTADKLVSDVQYLYDKYGSHPAFYLSNATSRYSLGDQPKPVFFVWAIGSPDSDSPPVEAEYWQAALDAIHALPQGGLVIANTLQGSWITGGHFDGLYNYATLHLEREGGFSWANSLPPGSLYIPSVIPGFSAVRIGYASDTFVPRENGDTYSDQWQAALGTAIEPLMVTVTSFNEWHEGSQIEPPAVGIEIKPGQVYDDFGDLPPENYLSLTREWVDTFLASEWPEAHRVRIQVTTTSDWTTLNIVRGGSWLSPELISFSPGATFAGMEAGDRLALLQTVADAERGLQVQMTLDLLLSGLESAGELVLNIERGNIGETTVTVFTYQGDAPVVVEKFYWSGITGSGRNSRQVVIPVSTLITASP
jgi:glycoprotein endo-alpha-1,2-mannosidase